MLTFDGIDPLAPPAGMVVVVLCTFYEGLSFADRRASNLMTSNLVKMLTRETLKMESRSISIEVGPLRKGGHPLPLSEKLRPCDSCE